MNIGWLQTASIRRNAQVQEMESKGRSGHICPPQIRYGLGGVGVTSVSSVSAKEVASARFRALIFV